MPSPPRRPLNYEPPLSVPGRPETPDPGVVRLREGDPRAEALEAAILATIYERGEGLPFPLVLGVLKLVEHRLIAETA